MSLVHQLPAVELVGKMSTRSAICTDKKSCLWGWKRPATAQPEDEVAGAYHEASVWSLRYACGRSLAHDFKLLKAASPVNREDALRHPGQDAGPGCRTRHAVSESGPRPDTPGRVVAPGGHGGRQLSRYSGKIPFTVTLGEGKDAMMWGI